MDKTDEFVTSGTFVREHENILSQVNHFLEIVGAQLDLIQTYPKIPTPDTNEILIAWKINFKDIVNQFSGLLRDHVERELAYLDAFAGEKIERAEMLRTEEVTEHLDELAWLLDNTPVRQIPVFIEYFKKKLEELRQGVAEHCQQGDRALGLTEKISESS
jgi:hypothetical protein